jgi:hypothetical protein
MVSNDNSNSSLSGCGGDVCSTCKGLGPTSRCEFEYAYVCMWVGINRDVCVFNSHMHILQDCLAKRGDCPAHGCLLATKAGLDRHSAVHNFDEGCGSDLAVASIAHVLEEVRSVVWEAVILSELKPSMKIYKSMFRPVGNP